MTRSLNRHTILCCLLLTLVFTIPSLAAVTELATNTGLSVPEGGVTTITSAQLRVDKSGVQPSELTYRITAAPAVGTLARSGVPLSVNSTFTQEDVNAGRLTYSHNGGETLADSFEFAAFHGKVQGMERVAAIGVDGKQPDDDLVDPDLSEDGRFVVFSSRAKNLVGLSQTDVFTDIFLYDRVSNTTTLISKPTAPFTQTNGISTDPTISADGNVIVFLSTASNLVPNDTLPGNNTITNVFAYNRSTEIMRRVSIAPNGNPNGDALEDAAVSEDGNVIAFVSNASNLTSLDTNLDLDVFVRDMRQATVELISVGLANASPNNFSYPVPAISRDGNLVGFYSQASNLVPDDTNNAGDIFVRDRTNRTTTRVSISSRGEQANQGVIMLAPALSADGQYVVFASVSTNLVPGDTNGHVDVFVHDRNTALTTRVSGASNGEQANNSVNGRVSVSRDGRYVVFSSFATNLIDAQRTQPGLAVYVRDRNTDQTRLLSVDAMGKQASAIFNGYLPAISAKGRAVVFVAEDTTLVEGDTNGKIDIFVADIGERKTFNIAVVPRNDPPQLSAFLNQRTTVGTPIQPIGFVVSDIESDMRCEDVGVGSDNPLVIPNSRENLLVGSSEAPNARAAACTLAIIPRPGQVGTARITVTASDGAAQTARTFEVEVVDSTPPTAPWQVILYMSGNDLPDGAASKFDDALKSLKSRLGSMRFNNAVQVLVLYDGNQNGDSELWVREPGQVIRRLSGSDLPDWFTSRSNAVDGIPGSYELDMGRVSTLRNYVSWAQQFPARHRMLSIINHGGGWAADRGTDEQPRGVAMAIANGVSGLSLDASANNGDGTALSTRQTGTALAGLSRLDIVFFDACLMGTIESIYQIQPYADYVIAGQNLLWADLPYQEYLDPKVLNANTSPEQFAAKIVELYNLETRHDDTQPSRQPFTIAAYNQSKLPAVVIATRELAQELISALPKAGSKDLREQLATSPASLALNQVVSDTLHFDYDADKRIEAKDAYVDLGDLATHLATPTAAGADRISPGVTAAARKLRIAIKELVIAQQIQSGAYVNDETGERAEWNFDAATGLSIYLPLKEQDCRPTGDRLKKDEQVVGERACRIPVTGKEGEPGVERQLFYYSQESQLDFTRDAREWSDLLVLLEPYAQEHVGLFNSPDPLPSRLQSYFLPVVSGPPGTPPLPAGIDLVVERIEVIPAQPQAGAPVEVRVTIRNRGATSTEQPFWVTLYVNPTTPPRLNSLCCENSNYGTTWRVYGLDGGKSKTLTTKAPNDPRDPSNNYSNFSTFRNTGQIPLFVQVDSFSRTGVVGAVEEIDETNNITPPTLITVTPGTAVTSRPVDVPVDELPE